MTEQEIAVELKDHENEIKSLKHRMDNAEGVINEVHEIATSVKLLAQESKNTGEKVDKLSDKVERIESKPAEEWSKLKTAIITAICTAIVTAAIAALITIL